MDGTRFDDIARRLATSGRRAGAGLATSTRTSRRGALAGVLGVLALLRAKPAAALPEPPGQSACLRPGERCDPERFWVASGCKKCCSGFSEERGGEFGCGCTPKGSGCGTSAACCENRDCDYGICGGPECYPAGGPCRDRGDCCSQTCGADGVCVGDAPAAEPAAAPADTDTATATDAGTGADTATADGEVTVGGDISGDGTISADGTTTTGTTAADGATTDGGTTTDTATADGAAPTRECRPAPRGCTLNEQCCSGSCVNGSCA